jgi:hypothetical protein
MAIRAFVSLAKPTNVVSFSKIETQSTYLKTQAVMFVPRLEASAYRADDSINQWFYEPQQATDSGILLSEIFVTVINKNLTDTTILSDLPALNYTFGTKAEIINIADNFTKIVTWNKTFTDAFTLDDLSQIDKDFYGNKGNIFAFTDIIGLTSNKALTDSYTISDVVSKVIAYSRSFTDSTTLSDSDYYSFGKISSDSFVFSDSQLKNLNKAKTDNLNFSDLIARVLNKPLTTDQTTLLDNFSSSVNKELTGDSVTFSDNTFSEIAKVFTDAFALDDSTLVDKDYSGNKGNVCTVSDIISFAFIWNRSFTHSFSFNDEDFYLLGKNIEGANENIGISDLVALATISGRVLNGASINTTTLN